MHHKTKICPLYNRERTKGGRTCPHVFISIQYIHKVYKSNRDVKLTYRSIYDSSVEVISRYRSMSDSHIPYYLDIGLTRLRICFYVYVMQLTLASTTSRHLGSCACPRTQKDHSELINKSSRHLYYLLR